MTVRVVVGEGTPVICKVKAHHTGLHANLVAVDRQQLFQPLPQGVVFPYFVELGERFQQVNVRVHRLVADRKQRHGHALQGHRIRIALDNLAVTRQPLKVAAILSVVRVFVDPAKSLLCEFERLGIFARAVRGSRPVDSKTYSVKMLAVGVEGRDLPFVVQAPVEASILLVPEGVVQVLHPMLRDRKEAILHFWPAHRDLRSNPRHAPLKHRELASTPSSGLPVTTKIRTESAILVVYRSGEPHVEYIAAQGSFNLVCELQVRAPGRRKVSYGLELLS